MNVIVRAGARLYQRPGAVKLLVLPQSRMYELLGTFKTWVQIGPQLWAIEADCTFIADAPSLPPPLPEPTPDPAPDGRDDLWFLKPSISPRMDANGKPHEGLPATWRTREGLKYVVRKDLQDLIIDVHCILHPELTRKAVVKGLSGLFRNNGGWCNGTGWDSDQFKLQGLSSEGATVQATVPGNHPNTVPGGGETWLEVHAIDPRRLPAIKSIADIDMTRWFFPTADRTAGLNLFPNFGGRCLVPLLGADGLQYVLAAHALKVDRVLMPSIPPRPDATQGLIP